MTTLNTERQKKNKRRKVLVLCIITVIELIISIWIVNVIDQILLTKSIENINLNSFGTVLITFVKSKNQHMFYLIFQVLYLLLLIQAYRPSAKIQTVQTRQITEDIEIPVAAGNGQHGNERFLREDEKEKIFQTFYYSGKETPSGKGGIVVQMSKDKNREKILYMGKDLHTLIIGASGSGKTRRILFETIWLQVMTGLSVIVSDVKGEIYYFTSDFAKKNGYECITVDLRNPKKSVRYNYLQPILNAIEARDNAKAVDYTWDLVSVLVGEQKGEPLWYNGESASIAAAILSVALEAPRPYKNLTNVYYFLAYMCQADEYGNMPLNEYLKQLPDNHPAKSVFAMAQIAAGRTRSSFFTSALGTLRLFTNPNVASMTSESDFDLKDVSRKKTIVYMMIPDDKKTLYPLVSILITQMYSLQVELANENGLRLPVDTDYNLDELGNFPTIPTLGNILSAGRSRGVRANLIIQDFQQLEKKYKDDYKNIRTNCQIKIYLKSDDPDTLKIFSEGLGKYTVEVSAASSSVSTDDRSKGMNFSTSSNLSGRALLEPAEVKRIKYPYALVMPTGEYSGINLLPDLSEYRLNEIYGMGGGEKENAQIMQERELMRCEREEREISLWGIWNEFLQQEEEEEEGKQEERISFI